MPRIVRASTARKWADYPDFVAALEKELEQVYRDSSDTFVSGNPNLTHEIKAKLIGREHLLLELIAFFKDKEVQVFFNPNNEIELVEDEIQESRDDEPLGD